MFKVDYDLNISMYEGDFGENLPIEIKEGEIIEGDVFHFIIQDVYTRETILDKIISLSKAEANTLLFNLTEEESKKITTGAYFWGLKQYRGKTLVDTLSANNQFEVIRGQ